MAKIKAHDFYFKIPKPNPKILLESGEKRFID